MGKVCTTCGEKKREAGFGVRRASRDGLTASCLDCLRDRDRARYPKESDYRIEQHRAYVSGEAGSAAHARAVRAWREKNALARAAHVILNNAIRDGKIVSPGKCSSCGEICVPHGHHDDYTKPLKVRWLCATCHSAWHKAQRGR